jgi:hypothetical protein
LINAISVEEEFGRTQSKLPMKNAAIAHGYLRSPEHNQ